MTIWPISTWANKPENNDLPLPSLLKGFANSRIDPRFIGLLYLAACSRDAKFTFGQEAHFRPGRLWSLSSDRGSPKSLEIS